MASCIFHTDCIKAPVTTRCFLLPRLSVTAVISEERMLSVRKHGDK